MTNVTIYAAMDNFGTDGFLNMDFDNVTSPSISPTQIAGYVDGVYVQFTGSFSYNYYGLTGGTVTGIRFSYQGSTLISYSGMSLDVVDLAYGYNIEQAMWGGNDTVTSHWDTGSSYATGSGNDTLTLGTGDDFVDGGSGIDTFILNTALAANTIGASGSAITVDGAKGFDTLWSVELIQFQDVTVAVKAGYGTSETLNGNQHSGVTMDIIYGNDGNDTIDGKTGNDRLFGNAGADRIKGSAGDDLINGGADNDSLSGGSGKDLLQGSGGADVMNGGGGNDTLQGQIGNDTLNGWSGRDVLIGGAGRDLLIGHKGNDVLTGGTGRDTFKFTKGHGNDRITDFEIGRDVIEIGKGANKLADLSFATKGSDVLVSFADVTILVEDVKIADLQDAANFDF